MPYSRFLRSSSAAFVTFAAVNSLSAQTTVASAVRADTSASRPSVATANGSEAGTSGTATSGTATTKSPLAPFGFQFSGYIESAFNRSNRASSGAITGRLYDRTNNQFALNALTLSVDRPYDPTRMDAGFHADAIVGQNARVLQSTGFSLGPNADVYQLFATLNVPTADGFGLQVKLGRMATFLGMELIETPRNPNVSIANQFIYAENFTQTGVSVEHRFNTHVDVEVRVLNGWDQVRDVNDRLSYMVRVGIAPDANSSIALSGFTGPEQANNNAALRSGVELLASHRTGRVTTYVQGDLGMEQRNEALPDPTHSAHWWAAGTWFVIEATPTIGVALRGDYLVDGAAARTGSAFGLEGALSHHLSSATATLNVKAVPHVLLRPELRFDRSNLPVFPAQNQQQVSFGLSASYLF